METVSTKALITRINRRLAMEHRALRKSRPSSRMFDNCGAYYLLDTWHNEVLDMHVDVEKLARKVRVLGELETVVG
jgi:hypothetical protein